MENGRMMESSEKQPAAPSASAGRGVSLEGVLARYARRHRRLRLTFGLGLTLSLLLFPLPFVCALDRFVRLSGTTRVLLWGLYVAAAAVLVGWFIVRRILQRSASLEVAFAIGDQLPELHHSLAAAVQFPSGQASRAAGVSEALVEALRGEAKRHAESLDVARLLPGRRALRAAGAAAALGLVQVLLLFAPGLGYAKLLRRFLNPFGNYDRVSGVEVTVTPGSVDAGDGETVSVEARVSDPEWARLGLYRGGAGATPQRFEMTRVQPGRFRFTLPNLRRDLTYYLGEGLVQTRTYAIRVRRRPRLDGFSFRFQYPKYTGLAAKEEERPGGDFSALAGTEVTLTVRLDTDVSRVVLRRMDPSDEADDREMALDGASASLRFKLEKTFAYQVVAFSRRLGLENEDRLTYRATAVPDHPPRVTILEPGQKTVRRDAAARQALRFTVRDEFPIQAVRLAILRAGREPLYRKAALEGLGTPRVQGRGVLSLPELNVQPGEEIGYRIEAKDRLEQWGQSAPRRIEIPVASGEAKALRLAQSVAPVRRGMVGTFAQLQQAHAAFARISKLLKARPLKWSAALESATTALRPALEQLRQEAAQTAGLAMQQREELADVEVREELQALAVLAADFDTALRRLDLEGALLEIRRDFKGRGPASAEGLRAALAVWQKPYAQGVYLLSVYERLLRARDLAKRGRQLTAAQQGVLVEGHARQPGTEARLRIRERMILEESAALAQRAKAVQTIGAKYRLTRTPVSLDALGKASAALQKELRASSELPMERVVKYAPKLQNAAHQLERWRDEHEAARIRYRGALAAARAGQLSVAAKLRAVAKGLGGVAAGIEEDPVDKEDELELLPPLIAELRRLLLLAGRAADELWRRAEAQARPSGHARWRLDLTRLGSALGALRNAELARAARQGEKISATFAQEKAEATPYLKALREAVAGLRKKLPVLAQQAEALEREERLRTLETRLARLLERQRRHFTVNGMLLNARALAAQAAGLAQALQAHHDAKAASRLAVIQRALGGRYRRDDPLPLPLVRAWDQLQEAASEGTQEARKARAALAATPAQVTAKLEGLRKALAAVAQSAKALAGSLPDAGAKKTGTGESSALVFLAPAQAEQLHRLTLAQRRAVNGLLEVLASRAAEPALQLARTPTPSGAGEAERFRAAFLMLWKIHREAVEPALRALESAEAVPDIKRKVELLGEASRHATEAARRLSQKIASIADPLGAGKAGLQAFLKRSGLSAEFAQGLREAAQAQKLSIAAWALGAKGLVGKGKNKASLAEIQKELPGLINELSALARTDAAARNPASHAGALENMLQKLSIIAAREDDLGRKLNGKDASEKAVKASYTALAQGAPKELSELAGAFSRAQAPAKRLGKAVAVEFAKTLAMVQHTRPAAERFAKQPTTRNGAAFAKALSKQGKEFGRIEVLVKASLDKQQRREADREAVEQLWPAWRRAVKKLAQTKARYDREEARRIAAYDEMVETARKGFKRLRKHIESGLLLNYMAPSKATAWFWRASPQRGSWDARPWTDLEWGKKYLANPRKPLDKPDPGTPPDAVKVRKGVLLFQLYARFFGRASRWCPVHADLNTGRHFTFYATHRTNGTVLQNVAQYYLDSTVKGQLNYAGLDAWVAHADDFIVKARKEKPADVPKLQQYKKELVQVTRMIEKQAIEIMPLMDSFPKDRHDWAKAVLALEKEFQPLAEQLAKRAAASGWKKPALDPRKRPTRRYRPSVPRLPSTIASAATLAALLRNELQGVAEYDLLAGERDKNADLAKTKKILVQKPPARALDFAAKLAAATGLVQEDVINYLGGEGTSAGGRRSPKRHARPGFPERLDGAIQRRFLEIGDATTLSRQAARWKKLAAQLRGIQKRYRSQAAKKAGGDAAARAQQHERLRRAFAEEVGRVEEQLRPVAHALAGRAAAGGWKPPKLDPTSQKKRRIAPPAPKADIRSAALCALGLASELHGLAQYDLLGGAADPNFDASIAKAKLAAKPPLDMFAYAARLLDAGGRSLEALLRSLATDPKKTAAAVQQLHADCRSLAGAGKKLEHLRQGEPAIRAAVEAAGSGGRELKDAFLRAQTVARRELARVNGDLTLIRTLAADKANPVGETPALAELARVASVLGEKTLRARFLAAGQALKANRPKAAAAEAAALVQTLRAQTKRLRAAIEALRAEKKSSAKEPSVTPAHVRYASETLRDLLFLSNLFKTPGDLRAESACALLAAARSLRRASELRVDALGLRWARRAGAEQRARLAQLTRIPGARSPAAVSRAAPREAARVLGRLAVRPMGRNPRDSGYGRLPEALMRELENVSLERKPPEAQTVWRRYFQILEHPPRVQARRKPHPLKQGPRK